MIKIEADFNHRDELGRLILADLAMHRGTPFASIAERAREVTFVDGEDVVTGSLVLDEATADSLEAWPNATHNRSTPND